MTEEELKKLGPGDIIISKVNSRAWMIKENNGKRILASRYVFKKTIEISNPMEWDVYRKIKE